MRETVRTVLFAGALAALSVLLGYGYTDRDVLSAVAMVEVLLAAAAALATLGLTVRRRWTLLGATLGGAAAFLSTAQIAARPYSPMSATDLKGGMDAAFLAPLLMAPGLIAFHCLRTLMRRFR